MKGGIDGNTQYIKGLSVLGKKELKLDMERVIILRAIKHMFINAVIARRVMQVDLQGVDSIAVLRDRLNRGMSMNDSVYQLSMQLAFRSFCMLKKQIPGLSPFLAPVTPATPPPGFTPEALQVLQNKVNALPKNLSVKAVQEMFNSGDLKRMRLDKTLSHVHHRIGTNSKNQWIRQRCTACGIETSYLCVVCRVPLHPSYLPSLEARTRANTLTCIDRWHENSKVEFTAESIRKRRLEGDRKKAEKKKRRDSGQENLPSNPE